MAVGAQEAEPIGAPARSRAKPGRSSWLGPMAVVAAVFVVSRLAYAGAGVRFLYGHAGFYLHFLDPEALRHDLFRSLWYDHAQPPGLNLVWGTALHVSGAHPERFLWPVFLATGLATSLLLLHLLKRVGLGRRAAVVVAALWTISPTAVLLETYLLYTPFEVCGVLAVVLLLARWAEAGRTADLAGLAAVVSTLALTRASFHLLWIGAIFALAAVVRRDGWRTVAVVGLVPLALVGGWYAKNLVLFDQFGPSTWVGNNLSRSTVEQLSDEERAEASARGDLSPYAPFAAFATFDEMGLAPPEGTGPAASTPVLDAFTRAGNPFPNLRQRSYLVVSGDRLDDAVWVIRHRPGAYARGVSRSASVTFGLPADFFGYGPNVDHIEPLVTAERWLLGGWSPLPPPASPALGRWTTGGHEWLVLAAYLSALGATPLVLWRRRRPVPATAEDRGRRAVALAAWGTVAYLSAVTILVDFGENNRFRSVTDPAVLVLLGWLLVEWRSSPERQAGEAGERGPDRAVGLRSPPAADGP